LTDADGQSNAAALPGDAPQQPTGGGAAADDVAYDATISMRAANLIAIALLPLFVAVLVLPFWGLWGAAALGADFRSVARLHILIPLFALLVVAHELLHAAGFLYFARVRREDIRFGMNWRALSPYAHCKAAVRARAYKGAVLLPGLLLGVLPNLIGLATGNGWLLLWGFFMAIAAAGDLAILWAIRRVPGDAIVRDHPSRAGCQVLRDASSPLPAIDREGIFE
jgi:hypothetical protein